MRLISCELQFVPDIILLIPHTLCSTELLKAEFGRLKRMHHKMYIVQLGVKRATHTGQVQRAEKRQKRLNGRGSKVDAGCNAHKPDVE